MTFRTQVPVWGEASSFVAVICTAYEAAAVAAPTVTVALAVPPAEPAGVVAPIVMFGSAGVTPVIARSTTRPVASLALTVVVACVPAVLTTAGPQFATGVGSTPKVCPVLMAPGESSIPDAQVKSSYAVPVPCSDNDVPTSGMCHPPATPMSVLVMPFGGAVRGDERALVTQELDDGRALHQRDPVDGAVLDAVLRVRERERPEPVLLVRDRAGQRDRCRTVRPVPPL